MGVRVEGLRETTSALEKATAEVGDQRATMAALASDARDELVGRLRRTSPVSADAARASAGPTVAVVTFPVADARPRRTNLRAGLAVPPTDAALEQTAHQVLEQSWNSIAEQNGLT